MNAHTKALTLLAGLLLFSSWSLQVSRFALPTRAPLAAPLAAARARTSAPTARQKVELGQRLSTVVRNPKQIKKSDVQAVRAAFGADSSKLLDLLRQSAD